MSSSQRRLQVLRAIVIEYVNSKEPVSSKTVASSYVTGVSSATIRNDMAALEEGGLIRQPHTSAGRIPTEAGYRIFVDYLDLSTAQVAHNRALLAAQLESVESLEDVIERAVRVLAKLTGQAAVAELPEIIPDRVRRVELVDLDEVRLLVIVVTAAGGVFEGHLILPPELRGPDGSALRSVRDAINQALEGVAAGRVGEAASRGRELTRETDRQLYDLVSEVVQERLGSLETSRIVTAGAANLARAGVDFHDVARVLEVLEDQSALIGILHNVQLASVQVSIGAENLHEGLAGASLVSATYGSGGTITPHAELPLSHVGVIGPTRMDYGRSLAAVEAVSGYLSRLLLKQSGASWDVPVQSQEARKETE
ncbi:heat-inducible transcriptional repressor HrcA [Actinomyces minihominis]|uniref:heat-inducible transcriptional repressor HrcA n=1 Tax=Actinomyces minihominis TaxID=2002838 RepID=UPI0013ED05E0|nr:heat-inducible transcriptional repressor HrcA [Actinomyces minihominis]